MVGTVDRARKDLTSAEMKRQAQNSHSQLFKEAWESEGFEPAEMAEIDWRALGRAKMVVYPDGRMDTAGNGRPLFMDQTIDAHVSQWQKGRGDKERPADTWWGLLGKVRRGEFDGPGGPNAGIQDTYDKNGEPREWDRFYLKVTRDDVLTLAHNRARRLGEGDPEDRRFQEEAVRHFMGDVVRRVFHEVPFNTLTVQTKSANRREKYEAGDYEPFEGKRMVVAMPVHFDTEKPHMEFWVHRHPVDVERKRVEKTISLGQFSPFADHMRQARLIAREEYGIDLMAANEGRERDVPWDADTNNTVKALKEERDRARMQEALETGETPEVRSGYEESEPGSALEPTSPGEPEGPKPAPEAEEKPDPEREPESREGEESRPERERGAPITTGATAPRPFDPDLAKIQHLRQKTEKERERLDRELEGYQHAEEALRQKAAAEERAFDAEKALAEAKARIETLDRERSTAKNVAQAAQDRAEAAKGELEAVREELEEARAETANVQQQLENAERARENDRKRLESQLEAKDHEIGELNASLEEKDTELQGLRSERDAAVSERDELSSKLEARDAEVSRLNGRVGELESEVNEQRRFQSELREMMSSMREEIHALREGRTPRAPSATEPEAGPSEEPPKATGGGRGGLGGMKRAAGEQEPEGPAEPDVPTETEKPAEPKDSGAKSEAKGGRKSGNGRKGYAMAAKAFDEALASRFADTPDPDFVAERKRASYTDRSGNKHEVTRVKTADGGGVNVMDDGLNVPRGGLNKPQTYEAMALECLRRGWTEVQVTSGSDRARARIAEALAEYGIAVDGEPKPQVAPGEGVDPKTGQRARPSGGGGGASGGPR